MVSVPAVNVSLLLNKTDAPNIGEVTPSAPLFTQTDSVHVALKVMVLERYALADDLSLNEFFTANGPLGPNVLTS